MSLVALAAVALLGSLVVAIGIGEDVTQHNGSATSDPQHLRLFIDHRPGWLISLARTITVAGAVPTLGVLSVLAAATLWWRGQRLLVALAPGVAFGCTGVIVAVAKQAVGRARPDLAVRLVTDSEASFPSGHSADSAALFVTFAVVVAAVVLRRRAARALTVAAGMLASGLVGLSRLVLAAHWPTDVLAGWAVGLAMAVTVGTIAALAARVVPPDVDRAHGIRRRMVSVLFTRRARFETSPFVA